MDAESHHYLQIFVGNAGVGAFHHGREPAGFSPDRNDGTTVHRLTVRDVILDGSWKFPVAEPV